MPSCWPRLPFSFYLSCPTSPSIPWHVVNPRLVWQLTVLIMLVDAAGYVAQRLVGARAGLPISGLLGGFVSSTAVVATMGKRAREEPKVLPAAVAGAALSNIATVVQLALVLAISDRVLLGQLRWVLLIMGCRDGRLRRLDAARGQESLRPRRRPRAAPSACALRCFSPAPSCW